jgi:hypothetical protein
MQTTIQRAAELCTDIRNAIPNEAAKAALTMIHEKFELLQALEQAHIFAAWVEGGGKNFSAFKKWYEKKYDVKLLGALK